MLKMHIIEIGKRMSKVILFIEYLKFGGKMTKVFVVVLLKKGLVVVLLSPPVVRTQHIL